MDELSNKGDGLGITEDGELGLYSGDKLLDSVPIQGGGEGTEEEWLQSLVGPQGEPGPMGPQRNPGEQGPPGEGISVSGAQPGQTVRIAAVDENGIPTAWEPADFPGEKNWLEHAYDFSDEYAASVKLELPSEDIQEGFWVFSLQHDGNAATGTTTFRTYCDAEVISGSGGYMFSESGLYTTLRNGQMKWEAVADTTAVVYAFFNQGTWCNTGYVDHNRPLHYLYIRPTQAGVLIKGSATLYYR